jgi:N4-gp56 family major capsid protein
MAITTLTQLPPEIRTYFDRLLLALARPYFIYDHFAQKRQIPLNSGDQMVFRRYGTLTAATVPLTDGQTPPGDQLSVTDFKAQINWYGSFVTITDQVQYVVQDRVLNESTKVLSLQLGLTIDTLVRDMMVSTASTILCSNGLNGSTPTEITDADIQTAIIALRQGNARLMTNPLPGEMKIGTAPVRMSYWGFMSVDLQDDLEAVSSFIASANYPNPKLYGVLKFSLIDMEARQGDMGQAELAA